METTTQGAKEMNRWTRVALVATSAFAGMALGAPMAHAGENGEQTNPSMVEVLPPEMLACIVNHIPVTHQAAVSKTCTQLNAATKNFPLTVVHTQTQLDAALTDPRSANVLVILRTDLSIATPPANPRAHITVHGTGPRNDVNRITVKADIQVTASGTAYVSAYYKARVVASGNARVGASGSVQVTASDAVTVIGFGSAQITATSTVKVACLSGKVVVTRV